MVGGVSDDDIEFHNNMIATAALAVARKAQFRGYVEAVDLQQALWEWRLRNKHRVAQWQNTMEEREFERLYGKVLFDEANITARRSKAERFGYKTSDEFFYTKGMLESLLPAFFDYPNSWLNPPQSDITGRSSKALSEGNNWLTTLSDVSRAYDALAQPDRELLRTTFGDDVPKKYIAEDLSLSRKGVDHRIDAALKRLWTALGGPEWLAPEERHYSKGTVGNRRAMSNAQARAITDSQWEDA